MADLTLSAGELLEARAGLVAIGSFSIADPKASYALTKIKRAANAALTDLEEARVVLCGQHAKKDDAGKAIVDGNAYVFTDPVAYSAAWQEMLKEPVVLSGCRALLLDEFEGSAEVVRIKDQPTEIIRGVPPDLFFSLGPLVVEPPAPDAPSQK